MTEIIKELERVLLIRKDDNSKKSYVKSLYEKGDEKILKKIIEEATEVLMAVKDNDKEHIIHETADLFFHLLVLLAHKNIKIDEVENELARRFGISGIIEKLNRNK